MRTAAVVIVLIILLVAVCCCIRSKQQNVFKDYYYFDANATTPIGSDAMASLTNSSWLGNASTDYANHNGAAKIIETASMVVRNAVSAPQDYKVCFNSGASEGNSYILRTVSDHYITTDPAVVPHIIASAVEHKSTLKAIESLVRLGRIEATLIQPIMDGTIDPVAVAEHIKPNTRLITIMHANNETGCVNDIKEIGRVAAAHGIVFHTDAAQTFCKLDIDVIGCNLDAVTISGHKIYGPAGVGAMLLSPRVAQWHIGQISGTQFDGLRGGTENLAGIAALATAITTTKRDRAAINQRLRHLKSTILSRLSKTYEPCEYHHFYGRADLDIPALDALDASRASRALDPHIGFTVFGDPSATLPGTLLVSFFKIGRYDLKDRVCNIKLKRALFDKKIIISIGSACNTKAAGPSHVLTAMRAPFVIRSGTVRISLLDTTSESDVEHLIKNLIAAVSAQV
jgi:cysteine desulfurase